MYIYVYLHTHSNSPVLGEKSYFNHFKENLMISHLERIVNNVLMLH